VLELDLWADKFLFFPRRNVNSHHWCTAAPYIIYIKLIFLKEVVQNEHSNMTSFFRFVDKRVIYRWYNLICTCAGECDWLFHWQHKLCAAFSASVNINCRFSIKVYYRICTLRHIKIEINHGSKNVFWVLTWVGGY
jgi:hypothetical protein